MRGMGPVLNNQPCIHTGRGEKCLNKSCKYWEKLSEISYSCVVTVGSSGTVVQCTLDVCLINEKSIVFTILKCTGFIYMY